MNLSVMTFHESFGNIPRAMLSLFKVRNVSVADFDSILMAYGWSFGDADIRWDYIYDHVEGASTSGTYRPSRYL